MSENAITSVEGRAVVVAGDDIDTDRIVPARFLRAVTFDDMGAALFVDERFTADGTSRGHAIDDPARTGARVMIAGRNFGCGSSREHAPQAIVRAGFGAVIAESFAEIFAANSLAIGLVCATVSRSDAARLAAAVNADPAVEVQVDLVASKVSWGVPGTTRETIPFTIPDDARRALTEGRWDPLFELLSNRAAVDATLQQLPYTQWRRA